MTQLNHLIGQLVAHGVPVNVRRLYEHRAPAVVDLERPGIVAVRPRVKLKTGLQPMRLPDSWQRAAGSRQTDPEPRAGAEVPAPRATSVGPALPDLGFRIPDPGFRTPDPGRPEPARRNAAPVMQEHFRTMTSFLDVQNRVMSAYLRRGNGRPSQRLPFIDAIAQHEAGRALTAVVHLDRQRHPFFDDHTLGRDVSVEDPTLRGLPVLPLTFTIEILAEAAAALIPGGVLMSIEQVRASRWITVTDRETLVVDARVRDAAAGVVEVSARSGDANGQARGPVLIEAMVRFA
jgi:hypothetical protein